MQRRWCYPEKWFPEQAETLILVYLTSTNLGVK